MYFCLSIYISACLPVYLSIYLSIYLAAFAEKCITNHFDDCFADFICFPFFFSSKTLKTHSLESPQKNSLQKTFKDRRRNFTFSSTPYHYLSEGCYPPPHHPSRCLDQIKTFSLEWLPRETEFNVIMLFMCQPVQLPANSFVT